jgi:hypothetical protein
MLAHGGSCHLEAAGDLARREFRVGHELQDGAAAGLGERAERPIHLVFSRITRFGRARGPTMSHRVPASCR